MKWLDALAENSARALARRTSRRSVLAGVGAFLLGAAAVPLLPVARGADTKRRAARRTPIPATRHRAITGGTAPSTAFCAAAAADRRPCARPGRTCRRSPGLEPATIRATARTTSSPTTTAAARVPAAGAFATATSATHRCFSRAAPMTTTGAPEIPRPTSPITARRHASWARPSSRSCGHRLALGVAVLSWAATNAAWGYQPAVNFQLNCMGCHLADGSGEAGRVPSLRRSLVLFSATPEGRQYVIRVPGVAQSPLSDAQTAALLNWMARNLSDVALPPGFADYTRSGSEGDCALDPLAQVSAMRARLLKEVAARKRD